ncbi:hypothetical protein K3495_g342 [Podosphaera aphanis]|nr:hypothetical protein K3495_g342 [Podosphaera aphanis]
MAEPGVEISQAKQETTESRNQVARHRQTTTKTCATISVLWKEMQSYRSDNAALECVAVAESDGHKTRQRDNPVIKMFISASLTGKLDAVRIK